MPPTERCVDNSDRPLKCRDHSSLTMEELARLWLWTESLSSQPAAPPWRFLCEKISLHPLSKHTDKCVNGWGSSGDPPLLWIPSCVYLYYPSFWSTDPPQHTTIKINLVFTRIQRCLLVGAHCWKHCSKPPLQLQADSKKISKAFKSRSSDLL